MIKHILEFMIYYNLYRRHGGIVKEGKGRTPLDAFEYYYNLKPELFKDSPNDFRKKIEGFCIQRNLTIYQKRNK